MQSRDEFRAGQHRNFAAFLVVLFVSVVVSAADASNFRVLHSFCKKLNCGDGTTPVQDLTLDQAGNLYGTAGGGAHAEGIVFELVKPVTGRRWQYKVLYHFCALSNCADGSDPTQSTLIVDTAGNLYGTTSAGGTGNDAGTVFELSPPIMGHHWTRRTIYNFCAAVSSCHDGANPSGGLTYAGREAGLPYDGVSRLYGVTGSGGGHFGGVAYSLVPKASGRWLAKVLYAFCQQGGQSCADGSVPFVRLTMDSAGNLYGTTTAGGRNSKGVAFELSPQAGGSKMTETVLHNLDNSSLGVVSGLMLDQNGNLFGFGADGGNGAACTSEFGCGTAFEISADRTFSVLYNFCEEQNCADGWGPLNRGGTYLDNLGNLYGTTQSGARNGIVFKLNGGTLQVLHEFCLELDCADGSRPSGGLTADAAGNLFGTTQAGGVYNQGTVFDLTP